MKKTDAEPVSKANYGEATPEQVVLALLRHRPDVPEAVKRRLPTQPRESVLALDEGSATSNSERP